MSRTANAVCRLVGLALSWWGTSLLLAFAHGQQGTTLETISRTWQARQDKVRSARFTWVERETIPRGYHSNLEVPPAMRDQALKDMGIPPGSVVPPQDTTLVVSSSLCLDGEKLRYKREGWAWSAKDQAHVPRLCLTVYDGKVGKEFYPLGAPYAPWPDGLILSGYPNARSLPLSPLVMTFRPFLPQMRIFDLHTMVLTDRRAVIDGKPYRELERKSGNSLMRVWVDSSRDYVIGRYLTMVNDRPRTKIDISYRKDAGVGWVPERWDYTTFYADGKLKHAVQAKVVSYQINPTVEAKEFYLEFPPGTRVHDRTNPQSPSDYIVREGNRKRMILREDIGATYEQMINSEPGEALGKRKRSFPTWPIGLATILLVIASGWLLWRRSALRNWLAHNKPI